MEHRTIGDLRVSVVGVGCNNFGRSLDAAGTASVVHAALDSGINFFDTADIYGGTKSEELLGAALGARRSEALIATKFGMPIDEHRRGAHPDYVARACEDSLRRLGTDHIDLYQLHYPDPDVPIADTLGALATLVSAGKVRQVGCSNMTADQIREARLAGPPPFVSTQNQFSLLWRQPETDGILDICRELGMSLLPFYPLANGLLTGKVIPGAPPPPGTRLAAMSPERGAHWLGEESMAKVRELLAVSESSGVPMLHLAFGWLLAHPEVASVIAGASNPEQVQANAAAAAVALAPRVVDELNALPGAG